MMVEAGDVSADPWHRNGFFCPCGGCKSGDERCALNTFTYPPQVWKRYVDDTFCNKTH